MNGDEGIQPFLANFLAVPSPYTAEMPRSSSPSENMIFIAVTRQVRLAWANKDFQNLHDTLVHMADRWLMQEVG